MEERYDFIVAINGLGLDNSEIIEPTVDKPYCEV